MPDRDPTSSIVFLADRCHTLARPPRANAVHVMNGRIAAVGTWARLRAHLPRGTRRVDLSGCTLTPGLVDAHTHFLYWSLWRQLVVDLSTAATLDDAIARIRTHAASRPAIDGWVLGAGFDPNVWAGGFPTARDLDRACDDHPVLIKSRDVHSAWINTAAMQQLGITRDTPDPPHGQLLRDADGRPTGILQEDAMNLLPDPVAAVVRRTDAIARRLVDKALDAGCAEAWRRGIVGVHSVDYGESFAHLARRRVEGVLGLRVAHAVGLPELDQAIALGLRSGIGDDWLRIGGVKMFSDGSLGSQTAYMLEPYPGRGGYVGVPVVAGEALATAVRRAVEHGFAAWVHAIGDRAVRETIDAMVATRKTPLPMPHRIEHAQCVRPTDVRRMARAGIVASVQPCHILGDIATAERHWPRVAQFTYPFRRMLDAGVTLAAGSDIPVESIDPRRSFFGAVCRMDEHHTPAGGWHPRERLTPLETLQAFTTGAAAAVGGLLGPGTLEPGAPADMTVWQADPLTVDPETLLDIPIAGCIVDGVPHLDGA